MTRLAGLRTTTPSRRAGQSTVAAPVVRGRGRPVGDRDAKRTELLRAAISVIAQEGFSGASLRKVAERAGCTTGAMTYYFANREEMIRAVVESLFDQYDFLLGMAGDPADIRAGLKRWLDWTNAEDPEVWLAGFQLLAYARHEPSVAVIYQRRYDRYRKALASAVSKAQKQGQVRSDIPAALLADQLSAMGDGWMMMFPIEPERFKPRRINALLDATIALLRPLRSK